MFAAPIAALADETSNPLTMDFAAGGMVRMKLNTGDMEVIGADADRISVSWSATDGGDEGKVKAKLQRPAEKEATVLVDGPGNHMHYRIEVPRRSDVVIHMRAGELTVRGIKGSVDADLLAGDMDLRLPEPDRFRSVDLSVTAGAIDAKPWQVDKAGLWRSSKAIGNGDYDLRARLIAGQLTIRAE